MIVQAAATKETNTGLVRTRALLNTTPPYWLTRTPQNCHAAPGDGDEDEGGRGA